MPKRNTEASEAGDSPLRAGDPRLEAGNPRLEAGDTGLEAGDRLLDAARATVLDFGVRRATLTEVARRAGLSRMTVYRRYSDGNELMRALMSREFGAVLVEAQARAGGLEDPLERVVMGVIGTLEMLMQHPLMLRLLELEPEMLVPYLTDRVGEFQQAGRRALAAWIARAQQQGAVRAGDPQTLADTIELAARGLVLSTRILRPDQREAAIGEFRRMIEGYLEPEDWGA